MNASPQAPRSDAVVDVERAATMPRIAIESVQPTLDDGRFPAKALAGVPVTIEATIFTDGHDRLKADVLWREAGEHQWQHLPMSLQGNDRWTAELTLKQPARVVFHIEAWIDVFASFREDLEKKYAAGQDLTLEMDEGRALLQSIQPFLPSEEARELSGLLDDLDAQGASEAKFALLLSPRVDRLVNVANCKVHLARSTVFALDVERRAAGFASWYELFPRSETSDPRCHGTFRDVIKRLPAISAMGFDVLYFPPIHPIGFTHRKGPNNTLKAGPDDPGSPYAIGSDAGGHEALHPQLGTLDDFLALVAEAKSHGLEIALDFAIQCSPDHPWLKAHPEWFRWRPDGSIRYAENPPKKYQDIVNVDFYAQGAIPSLWEAWRDIILLWVERGVSQFRVDNPHTKPMPFWAWLIADVRRRHPHVIFLAEAFTRPAMMARLGKLGFSQSYTYFTWRNTKAELETYFRELNSWPLSICYRPNFFVNTPDINPFYLHHSGRAGFLVRAVLATMGSGLWGMYSGFEICESAPLPGREEYLDSEKYQIRVRDYGQEGNIVAEISRLNQIRRENPALQSHLGFEAYNVWNDNILLFGKRTPCLSNFILVAVNLDPHHAQEAHFEIPLWEFGLPDEGGLEVEDLMNGHHWTWWGKTQWMRLEPWQQPFGLWRVKPAEGQ